MCRRERDEGNRERANEVEPARKRKLETLG